MVPGPSAAELARQHAEGKTPPKKAVEQAFARAAEVDAGPNGLNAILWADREAALGAAGQVAELARQGNQPGPLAGVPVVVKDNIATLTMPTTCGSRILEGYVSPYEATVVKRLREAGGIVFGKTNMDEFAMGSSTENSAYGPTRNPLAPDRVPGGSSGGSAAAVAAGIVSVALGSETGGSVRQPAAFCGIVGVKPTYGRVSRFGLVAFASSLDQVGVVDRGAEDADVKDLVIGLPKEYFPPSLDPAIRRLCDAAVDRLRALGATVKEVSLPHTDLAIPVYYII